MTARKYLEQVRNCDIHINNMLEELQRLRDFQWKITSTLRMDGGAGGGGYGDKIGSVIAKIVDLDREINMSIDDYVDIKREIRRTIEGVTDPYQLDVLYKRYFLYKGFEDISKEMHMTYRNACYIHGRALQSVEAILNGRGQK